jgi:UDPglucose 6-dehydrogenase
MKEKNIKEQKIIVNKSTVPVGTVEKIQGILKSIIPEELFAVASNPEFLREGFAVDDAMKPERVVIGTDSKYAETVLRDLYVPFVRSGNPIYVMDIKSAEITKYAANSFLAIKISFMNDLSAYCEKVGADIEKVRIGIGSDSRIGKRFLFAGIGYGGSCFPKDVSALIYSTTEAGTPMETVQAAHNVNYKQRIRFIDNIFRRYNNNIKGKTFALWGLAFKPNTDDTREAPAFTIIEKILEYGGKIKAFDSEAVENTKLKFGDTIEYAKNMYDCLKDTDSLIIATEWNEFRSPDFAKMKSLLKEPLIFDGRNMYNPDEVEAQGFEYFSIGRKNITRK